LRISRLASLVLASLLGGVEVASAAPRIEVVVTIRGLDGVSSLGPDATLTYTARYPSTGTYQAASVFAVVFAEIWRGPTCSTDPTPSSTSSGTTTPR
jgi:hypothetical protein